MAGSIPSSTSPSAGAPLRHHESSGFVAAPPEALFAHLDDYAELSAHMTKSSWMMGGGRMEYGFDEGQGRKIGSRVRMKGRAFGIGLELEERVTEREPPRRKAWETIGSPRLWVIGHYRMGLEIAPHANGARLKVFIDYALPERNRWLGLLFAGGYARWCTERMVNDAVKHFERSG